MNSCDRYQHRSNDAPSMVNGYRAWMPRTAVRLAVVNSQTGCHCGGWRIWAKKNDVYIAPLKMGDRLKVSLHPEIWQVAFTSEHWASGRPPNNAPGPGRSVWEVEHLPEVRDGVQHAWFI